MKKLLIIVPIVLIILFLILQPIGSSYDTEIENVVEEENQYLADQGVNMEVTRKETDFYIYAGGGYVEMLYNDADGEEQQIVYEEMDNGDYTRHVGMPEEVANLTNEYDEQNR
jgi:uncharacterized protein YxeA